MDRLIYEVRLYHLSMVGLPVVKLMNTGRPTGKGRIRDSRDFWLPNYDIRGLFTGFLAVKF
jgi:hypothetical protein